MKTKLAAQIVLALSLSCQIASATDRYVSLNGGHVPPFLNWADAATNIQVAIDASAAGDTVWVTNGVYNTGGKVMAGDLTNRIALDKALTVRSVNGPDVTMIEGVRLIGTNAVRCAWLTNGASLIGLTFWNGATRMEGDDVTLRSGGGVWCESTNATLVNCHVDKNLSSYKGGGVYRGVIIDCQLTRNASFYGGGTAEGILSNCFVMENSGTFQGGGAYSSTLQNCTLEENTANSAGGGAYMGTLHNCALKENFAFNSGGGAARANLDNCTITLNSSYFGAGGVDVGNSRNCIIYYNSSTVSGISDNYSPSPFAIENCCTLPLPTGIGNISSDPQLLEDSIHLAESSPCRGRGNAAYVTGTDLDHQSWEGPPAIGCDEWHPEPFLVEAPEVTSDGGIAKVTLKSFTVGAEPFSYQWLKDGVLLADGAIYSNATTPGLLVPVPDPLVVGEYQTVVSNAYGVSTGLVTRLKLHFVKAGSSNPQSPYSVWDNAAANIQDAVEVAAAGDVVVVTNGVYDSGGVAVNLDLTNRVGVDKMLTIASVNGPDQTIIQGAWDPTTTNGALAVRCVYLSPLASLKGFTLRGGATLSAGTLTDLSGGGVYGGIVSHCRIIGNYAQKLGGGCAYSFLSSSQITGNHADQGGGCMSGQLDNCTVTENTATVSGGGVRLGTIRNSIVYFNSAPTSANYDLGSYQYSCSIPLTSGTGNISDDPLFLGSERISSTSPCRAAGSSAFTGATDIDDEPWLNPPSMGCDEIYEAGLTGALAVALSAGYPEVAERGAMPLSGEIDGRSSNLEWNFGDGISSSNLSYLTTHVWTNSGDYTVTFTAYNTDNPGGVSTNLSVHVVPLETPVLVSPGATETAFSVGFFSQYGVTYVVERTASLDPPINWQTVTTRFGTGGLITVNLSKGTDEIQFYRIRVP